MTIILEGCECKACGGRFAVVPKSKVMACPYCESMPERLDVSFNENHQAKIDFDVFADRIRHEKFEAMLIYCVLLNGERMRGFEMTNVRIKDFFKATDEILKMIKDDSNRLQEGIDKWTIK